MKPTTAFATPQHHHHHGRGFVEIFWSVRVGEVVHLQRLKGQSGGPKLVVLQTGWWLKEPL